MSYVDDTFYKETYKGDKIPDDLLEQRLNQASRDIDGLTYNRIVAIGIESLTDFQKSIIKESVCLHADFYYQYGDILDSPIAGYSAGSTSLSFKSENISGQNGITTSNRVFSLLKQTGLTTRLFI